MKAAIFLGTSLVDLRDFPVEARREPGVERHQVQLGLEPSHWKAMPSIGPGVQELRNHADRSFRVIDLATRPEGVYGLHCFRRKPRRSHRAALSWHVSVTCKSVDEP